MKKVGEGERRMEVYDGVMSKLSGHAHGGNSAPLRRRGQTGSSLIPRIRMKMGRRYLGRGKKAIPENG